MVGIFTIEAYFCIREDRKWYVDVGMSWVGGVGTLLKTLTCLLFSFFNWKSIYLPLTAGKHDAYHGKHEAYHNKPPLKKRIVIKLRVTTNTDAYRDQRTVYIPIFVHLVARYKMFPLVKITALCDPFYYAVYTPIFAYLVARYKMFHSAKIATLCGYNLV